MAAALAALIWATWAISFVIFLVLTVADNDVAANVNALYGADLTYELDLTLEQAVHGSTENIKVATWVCCGVCNGSGQEGTSPTRCGTCNGTGQVQMQHGFILCNNRVAPVMVLDKSLSTL